MNFKTLALTAVAAALCAQGAFAATAAFKVNGQTVTKAEQDEIIKMLVARGQQQTPELEAAVKNQLIRQTVLLQEAKKAKVDRRADVKKAVKSATDSIYVNAFVADYAKKHPVTDADARKVFDENRSAGAPHSRQGQGDRGTPARSGEGRRGFCQTRGSQFD